MMMFVIRDAVFHPCFFLNDILPFKKTNKKTKPDTESPNRSSQILRPETEIDLNLLALAHIQATTHTLTHQIGQTQTVTDISRPPHDLHCHCLPPLTALTLSQGERECI